MALKNNTWKLNQWYDQNVAGNVSYSGSPELWAWGKNENGDLAQNNIIYYSSPVQIPGTTWSSLARGWDNNSHPEFLGALKSDGTLWIWGKNDKGQLGQNQASAQLTGASSPVQIPGTDWAASDFGYQAWAAVKTNGTLWMCGNNSFGGLGQNQGPGNERSSPTQVPGTTWTTEINGGDYNWIAIKTDGTLWAWGNNSSGQLGQNNTSRVSSPVQVGSGTDWSKVGKAYRSQGAIKTDGTLWVWGQNEQGVLGQNQPDTTDQSSPIQLPGTWSSWSGSSEGSGGIKTDGTLWSWGHNDKGQLGLNNTTEYSSPVQVGSGTDWSKSIFGTKSLGLKTDGTLWTWGNNVPGGQLGQNNETLYSSPVQIPGNWSDITAGDQSSMALKNV